ncbi:SPOR domain-containing protein [Hydrocarboniphaga effusa]|jgi:cell division protein FtsN|uniref:SPOR domain-containing protein n=1 Tax=Hydrocarboniphaga effusa AP103 TaxID=1172194 RepID=I8I5M4_9GAMM|nr:SPOR domain-containing protein [Hydrocarboniphaga effusa]EIT71816.1 hypothetical protein WQQ_19530 [Hydrocarboniphaga effusa AP103]
MASRDYAARNRKPSRGKPSGGGLPGWVWAFVGLSVGLVVAVFVYISRPTETPLRGTSASLGVGDPETASELVNGKRFKPNEIEDIADRKAAAAKAKAKSQAEKSADKDDKIAVPPKEKSRFTFYELLPSQEVLVPSQADGKTRPGAAPPPANAATAGSGAAANAPGAVKAQPGSDTFIIQVASYKAEAEAERQKAALALIGVESRIEKVTIDNRDTYYRVRVGPVKDEAKARDTLAQLESNGINGMLVRVK